MRLRKAILPVGLVLIAVLAAAQVVYSTRLGLWAQSDSSVYLAAARNLLAGEGLRVIQPSGKEATLMPPLYSLKLAALGWLGFDLLDAARWLNVVLAGVSMLLSGWVMLRFSRTRWLALPGTLLLALFPVTVDLYSGMMTEAMYLTLMLFSFGALLAYLDQESRGWLAAAALAAGLGVLARFVGIVFLPAGVLAVLLLARSPWKRRLGDAMMFSAVSVLPVAAWAIWLYANPDASPALGGPEWSNPWAYLAPVRNGMFGTLWSWLPFADVLPRDTKLLRLATVLAALLLPALAAIGARRLLGRRLRDWLEDRDARLAGLAAISIASFIAGFVLIYLFRSPAPDVDRRTLLPLFPLILFLLLATLSLWLRGFKGRGLIAAQAACALVLLAGGAAYLPASLRTMQDLHANGRGYSSPAWQNSAILAALKDVPPDLTRISNDNGALLYFTGRTALEVRERLRERPAAEFTRFGDDPEDDVQVLFRDGKAVLVLFMPQFYWQIAPVYGEQTDARIDALLAGLEPLYEGADGGIYRYPREP